MSLCQRFLRLALVLGCFVSGHDLALSQESSAAEQNYNAAVAAANEAIAGARSKLIAALTAEMTSETKKGNLDGAVAIRSKIRNLELQDAKAGLLRRLADTTWTSDAADGKTYTFQFNKQGILAINGAIQNSYPLDERHFAFIRFGSRETFVLEFDEDFRKFEQYWGKGQQKPGSIGRPAAEAGKTGSTPTVGRKK
jgi:hypothetical protein